MDMDNPATPTPLSFSSLEAITRFLANPSTGADAWDSLSKACFEFDRPVESEFARFNDFELRIEAVKGAISIRLAPESEAFLFVIGGGVLVGDDTGRSEFVKKGDHVRLTNRDGIFAKPVAGYGDSLILCISQGLPAELAPLDNASKDTAEAPYYWGYDRRYAQTYAAGGDTWETTEPNEIVTRLTPDLISDRDTQQIIDLGCGEGRDTLWLAKQGYCVTGVDVSSAALGRARQLAQEQRLSPLFLERDVIFLRGIADNTYAAAFNMGCLHMLDDEDDRRRHLARVFEILEPGGSFVVNHCRDQWLKGFWSVVDYEAVKDAVPGEEIPRRIRRADGTVEMVNMEVLRHKVKSEDALKSELDSTGFEDIRILNEDHFTFGNSAILVCRKPAT